MGSVKHPKECLVCLSASETIFVPNEESQKIFNICCSYVKDAINVEFLIKNINRNSSQLSFCINCFHSSLNLSLLVEQLSKLKKEINDVASSFSEKIGQQRIKAKTKPATIPVKNVHKKCPAANNQSGNSESSNRVLLNTTQSESEKHSFVHPETSKDLINDQVAADKIDSEIVKTENDGIFLYYEDNETCTANSIDHNGEECETNALVVSNEMDPLGDINLERTSAIVSDCNIFNESKPQIETSNTHSKLFSSVTMPKLVLKRVRNRGRACKSTKSLSQDNPGVTSNKDIPEGHVPNRNTTPRTRIVKQKTSKIRKKDCKHICTVCSKAFSTSFMLKRHHLIHTGEKPYKCSMCEKAFSQSNELKIHERIHTGERPYKCSWCKKSFVRSHNLKHHEKAHHKAKPTKCS